MFWKSHVYIPMWSSVGRFVLDFILFVATKHSAADDDLQINLRIADGRCVEILRSSKIEDRGSSAVFEAETCKTLLPRSSD